MLLLTESAVHTRKYLLRRHAVWTEWSEVHTAWRHNKYFPYGPNSRLIRASLYTHTSKTTKSQCFPLLLWTEVQPVHTPVRTEAYGPALSQSNFSILSVFCLVYNNVSYALAAHQIMLPPFYFGKIYTPCLIHESYHVMSSLIPSSIVRCKRADPCKAVNLQVKLLTCVTMTLMVLSPDHQ